MDVKVTFDDSGFRKLEKDVQNANSKTEITFGELFNDSFMRQHTSYQNYQDFMNNCGFPCETREEFLAIPDEEFDVYVNKTTNFSNWEEMMVEAQKEQILKKLDF